MDKQELQKLEQLVQLERDVLMLKDSMMYLHDLTYEQHEKLDTLEEHIQQSKREMENGVVALEETQESYVSPYYKYATIVAAGIVWFML
jgi:t-SNARE complex subunit (syntaxin)